MVQVVKFSQFGSGGTLVNGQIVVGLTPGPTNAQFTAPPQFVDNFTSISPPISPSDGTIGYATDIHAFQYYNGTAWLTFVNAQQLGQAAYKNVTNNALPVVASVVGSGSFVPGNILIAGDAAGTVMDGGNPVGTGTVTSVGTGLGLTGGPITASGTISMLSTLPASIQLNITQLGTVVTGVWNGSVIGATYGGTGINNGASTITIGGNITFTGAFGFTGNLTATTNVTFPTSGTLATTSQLPAPSALTSGNDTNVTLTLGGSPTVALLAAVSITAGWAGQLSLTRGGTNASLTASAGAVPYSSASALALSAVGTSGQLFQSAGTSAPAWTTATFPATAGSSGNVLVSDGTNWSSSPTTLITSLGTQAQALNMGSFQINNLGNPTVSTDAATKGYADTIASGLNPIGGVYCASTANLTGYVYNNGSSGVGATLTAPSIGVFTLDSQTPAVGARVLYKNDSTYSGAANGIYNVTTSSSLALAVLTRATDYDTPAQINPGDIVFVENGVVNKPGVQYYETATVSAIGIGNPISFSIFFNPASYFLISNNLSEGTPATMRSNLGLVIGTNVEAWSAVLDAVAAGTYTGSTSITTLGTIATGVWNGTDIALNYGGTNAALTASNGGIVYSTASAMAILAGTATAGLALLSGASTAPTWSNNPPITKINVQTFTSSGTYTPTTGMKYCVVELVGGGGGGGGAPSTSSTQSAAGGGGGGGGYSRKTVTAAAVGSSQTVTIGAAGTTTAGSAGGNGGTTSLGSIFSATGGTGGVAGTALTSIGTTGAGAGGAGGGNGSSGDVNVTGGNGLGSTLVGTATTASCLVQAGFGGHSLWGAGGTPNPIAGANTNSQAGSGYGGGGSGAANGQSQASATAGGAPTAGYMIITEYIST